MKKQEGELLLPSATPQHFVGAGDYCVIQTNEAGAIVKVVTARSAAGRDLCSTPLAQVNTRQRILRCDSSKARALVEEVRAACWRAGLRSLETAIARAAVAV